MPETSIRNQLLRWLLLPLCSLLLVGSLFAYVIGYSVSNYTYDRALLNSAEALAARLRWTDSSVTVDMPPAAQAILRYNEHAKIYFQVLTQDLERISGDVKIPGPVVDSYSNRPGFRDALLENVRIRVARLRCTNPNNPDHAVLVQVAETLEGRHNLTRLLTLSIIAPQILLIGLGSAAVWSGVGNALRPLGHIQRAVQQRNPRDLSRLVFTEVPLEVRPLLESLNNLLVQLSHEIETQRRFVANAAHQLRTPLAGLRTYTGIAQKHTKDPRTDELLNHIDTGIDRMVHTVSRLLCLARIEPGQSNHKHIDLNFVASDSTSELVEAALSKNIDLSFEACPKPALVFGSRDSLHDLATNLIENAVLYTPAGGHVCVRITNGNGIHLSVEDDGPGIPESERDRVFERFYRLRAADVPGSGLGLSIVGEIAVAHNARLSVQSGRRERGTKISVSFGDESHPAEKTPGEPT